MNLSNDIKIRLETRDFIREEIRAICDYVDRDSYNIKVAELMITELAQWFKTNEPCLEYECDETSFKKMFE